MKKIFIQLFILSVLLIIPKVASAGLGFSVEPAIIKLDLERGESAKKSIFVKNIADSPLPLSLVFRDFSNEDSVEWVKINSRHFILKPKESKEVIFSINIPINARLKSYTGYLYFEPQIEKTTDGTRTLGIMAAPLLISVVDREEKKETAISIEQVSISENLRLRTLERFVNRIINIKTGFAKEKNKVLITEKNPNNFKIALKNNGDYYYYPKGTIELFNNKDKLLAQANIKGGVVLPNSEREYEVSLKSLANNQFSYNVLDKYYAKIDLDSGQSAKVSFWFFPWKRTFHIIIFLSVIMIIFLARKRFLLAFRTLLPQGADRALYKVERKPLELKNIFIHKKITKKCRGAGIQNQPKKRSNPFFKKNKKG